MRGRVLLLDQNFDILGTVGIARAIRMTLRENNPVVVHAVVPDKFLTSAGGRKFEVPSVISLKNYLNLDKKRRESFRDNESGRLKIYIRDGFRCQYCNVKASSKPTSKQIHIKELTLDHIMPKSRNGTRSPENLVTACLKCNQRKADRTPSEANMPLLTPTHKLKTVGMNKLLICSYLESNPLWAPFLEGREDYKEALEMVNKAKAA